jgi:hypothetical protein
MAAFLSIPQYPNAVGYDVQYSDPLSGDPNAPNPFGPWESLVTNTTQTSSIGDPGGDPTTRLYRVRPYLTMNGSAVPFQWYSPFSAESPLYDSQITTLVAGFRTSIDDEGTVCVASTEPGLDDGGTVLLAPDGVTTTFSLTDEPDTTAPIILENDEQVIKNGKRLLRSTDYTMDYERGRIIFATAPEQTDSIEVTYRQVRYTNRKLSRALGIAIDSLSGYQLSGYGTSLDNNLTVVNGSIGNDGLRPILYHIGLKILNRAAIRKKSDEARAYKSGSFSYDSAPGRIVDGMGAQDALDDASIQAQVSKYITTVTVPLVRTEMLSWFDYSGNFPVLTGISLGLYYAGYSAYL